LPRVWLELTDKGTILVVPHEDDADPSASYPVDMNASLYRQILAANRAYMKFQTILMKFFSEAGTNPRTVRRVR
jgi:hypothetical protein